MNLYHFTACRFVASIKRQGITRGFVLLQGPPLPIKMTPDYRWLTANPEWAQDWAVGTGRLPYSRTECRLTIEIPDAESYRVSEWKRVGPILTPVYDILSEFGDPENWRLFRGDIPADWIVAEDYERQAKRA